MPWYWLIAFKLIDASSSDCPPERKQIPGTATGTVLCNAVTVARPTSSGVYFFLQSKPKYIFFF